MRCSATRRDADGDRRQGGDRDRRRRGDRAVISLRLAAEGAVVVVADVDPGGGEETVAVIQDRGGNASFVSADVRATEDVRGMIAAAAPGPHILVNNAGGGGHVEPHFPSRARSPICESA